MDLFTFIHNYKCKILNNCNINQVSDLSSTVTYLHVIEPKFPRNARVNP